MSLPVFHSICSFLGSLLWLLLLGLLGLCRVLSFFVTRSYINVRRISPLAVMGLSPKVPDIGGELKKMSARGCSVVCGTRAQPHFVGGKKKTRTKRRENSIYFEGNIRERGKKKMRQRGRERKERMKKALDDNSQANI
jgi:hypothetical protein